MVQSNILCEISISEIVEMKMANGLYKKQVTNKNLFPVLLYYEQSCYEYL